MASAADVPVPPSSDAEEEMNAGEIDFFARLGAVINMFQNAPAEQSVDAVAEPVDARPDPPAAEIVSAKRREVLDHTMTHEQHDASDAMHVGSFYLAAMVAARDPSTGQAARPLICYIPGSGVVVVTQNPKCEDGFEYNSPWVAMLVSALKRDCIRLGYCVDAGDSFEQFVTPLLLRTWSANRADHHPIFHDDVNIDDEWRSELDYPRQAFHMRCLALTRSLWIHHAYRAASNEYGLPACEMGFSAALQEALSQPETYYDRYAIECDWIEGGEVSGGGLIAYSIETAPQMNAWVTYIGNAAAMTRAAFTYLCRLRCLEEDAASTPTATTVLTGSAEGAFLCNRALTAHAQMQSFLTAPIPTQAELDLDARVSEVMVHLQGVAADVVELRCLEQYGSRYQRDVWDETHCPLPPPAASPAI